MKQDVAHIAAKDITKYLEENNIVTHRIIDGNIMEVYVVTPSLLINKHSRFLNRKLGLSGLNKFGQKMNHKKK